MLFLVLAHRRVQLRCAQTGTVLGGGSKWCLSCCGHQKAPGDEPDAQEVFESPLCKSGLTPCSLGPLSLQGWQRAECPATLPGRGAQPMAGQGTLSAQDTEDAPMVLHRL